MKRQVEDSAFEILETLPGIYDCFFGSRWIATVGPHDDVYSIFRRVVRNEAAPDEQETVKRILARETVRLVLTVCDGERS
jgi:hypothetical protein